jgi:PAS domain S-box-containing protein
MSEADPLHLCVSSLPHPAAVFSAQGVLLQFNEGFEALLQVSAQELLGRAWMDWPVSERQRFAPILGDFSIAPELDARALTLITETGEEQFFAAYRSSGSVAGECVLVSLVNLEPMREQTQAWRRHAESYRAMAENSPDVILRFDRQLRAVYANAALRRFLSIAPELMLGHRLTELLPDEPIFVQWEQAIARCFETGMGARRRVELSQFSPSLIFDWSLTPERHESGRIAYVLSSARDISEQVRIEQALQESEESYRKLFEHSNDAILILDQERQVVDANSRCAEWLGVERKAMMDRSFLLLLTVAERELGRRALERASRDGAARFETWLRCVDGHRMPVDVDAKVLDLTMGTLQLVMRDITEHKQAEEEILAQRRSFTSIVEKSAEGILVADQEAVYYANPAARRWLDGVVQEAFNGALAKVLESGEAQVLEMSAEPPCVLELSATDTVWHDQSAMLLTIRDITAHDLAKHALRRAHDELEDRVLERTEELRASNERLQLEVVERRRAERELRKFHSAVEHSSSMVMITDAELVIEYVNPRFSKVAGYSGSELQGRTPRMLRPAEGSRSLFEILRSCMQIQQSWHGELGSLRRDGSRYWQLTSVAPVRAPTGRVTHFVIIADDISQRKQNEEELLRAKDRAEAANRAKSQFLAGMSHELRTPLNSVIGFSQVLAEQFFGQLNAKQSEYVQDILSSGKHLLSLINDILDLAKIEADKQELDLGPVDVAELLRRSLAMLRERANAQQQQLRVEIDERLEGSAIQADERRLKQVLFNLLSNAMKFTPEQGAIRLSAQRRGALIEVEVRDSGIGLESRDLDRIFEPFYQVSSGVTGKTPGTGLGLCISRAIVEMHGGLLWAESEGRGMGTRMIFTLPFRPVVTTGETLFEEGET